MDDDRAEYFPHHLVHIQARCKYCDNWGILIMLIHLGRENNVCFVVPLILYILDNVFFIGFVVYQGIRWIWIMAQIVELAGHVLPSNCLCPQNQHKPKRVKRGQVIIHVSISTLYAIDCVQYTNETNKRKFHRQSLIFVWK